MFRAAEICSILLLDREYSSARTQLKGMHVTRKLAYGIIVEQVGEEFLLLRSETAEAHRLPPEFRELIEALLTGQDTSAFPEQMSILDELGVLEANTSSHLSRRGVVAGMAGVVGAGAASLALPATAVASSPTPPTPTFFVSDTLFDWLYSNVSKRLEIIASALPDPPFAAGSTWTLTLDPATRGDGTVVTFLEKTETVGISFDLFLFFAFPEVPDFSGEPIVLSGRLSSPDGDLSNQFNISERP